MSKITNEIIEHVMRNEVFSQNNSSIKDKSSDTSNDILYKTTSNVLFQDLTLEDVANNYELGEKHINKLKRVNPSQKIIDGFDIDWTGFKINFLDKVYTPKTSYELFELIFRILEFLYLKHVNTDIIWNDSSNGDERTQVLNWCDSSTYSFEDFEQSDIIKLFSNKHWNSKTEQ